jgi:hypothetical protein
LRWHGRTIDVPTFAVLAFPPTASIQRQRMAQLGGGSPTVEEAGPCGAGALVGDGEALLVVQRGLVVADAAVEIMEVVDDNLFSRNDGSATRAGW